MDATMSAHHLVPKSQGGTYTEVICSDCHSAIHARYSNKQLAADFNTLESIKQDADLQRAFKWIAKQNPSRRFRNKRSNHRRKRK
jgi:hypothetical protein